MDVDHTWQAWAKVDPLELINFGGDPYPHVYAVTVVYESCVWQQGSTLRRRQRNRIELYALVNPKPK